MPRSKHRNRAVLTANKTNIKQIIFIVNDSKFKKEGNRTRNVRAIFPIIIRRVLVYSNNTPKMYAHVVFWLRDVDGKFPRFSVRVADYKFTEQFVVFTRAR